MSSQSKKMRSISGFFTQLMTNTQTIMKSEVNYFYQNVLNLNFEQESIIQQQQFEIPQQKYNAQDTNKETGPSDILQNSHLLTQQKPKIYHHQILDSQLFTKSHKNKFKINPRLNKLSRISKNISIEKSTEKNQNSPKNSQSKQKFTQQINQIRLKKLELKSKLRKLDSQLEKQKHSYFSFQSHHQLINQSQMDPQQQNLLSKLKNSCLLQNKTPQSFSFSRFKSKSDSQFSLKRQSLKDKQAVYSPEKHETAFKLIQKFHSQKIKKNQKILDDMKKKQQKQIETVKRLQIERKKQREQRLKRQKVFLTPKLSNSLKNSNSCTDRNEIINPKSKRKTFQKSFRFVQKLNHSNIQKLNIHRRTPTQSILQDVEEQNRLKTITNQKVKPQQIYENEFDQKYKQTKEKQNQFPSQMQQLNVQNNQFN